ncbi:MAG: alpha amylase C-terminal domain-containing protein [Lachnospiraceae bacterium]|nr:alpha amylase C-terminal domain-containing protein [Lachnospiraceae bacterium]
MEGTPANVVAYTLENEKEIIFVVYNANKEAVAVELPNAGAWKVCVDGDKADATGIREINCKNDKKVELSGISCLVVVCTK